MPLEIKYSYLSVLKKTVEKVEKVNLWDCYCNSFGPSLNLNLCSWIFAVAKIIWFILIVNLNITFWISNQINLIWNTKHWSEVYGKFGILRFRGVTPLKPPKKQEIVDLTYKTIYSKTKKQIILPATTEKI